MAGTVNRTTVVPTLVGLEVRDAREVCGKLGLVVASADPDGPSIGSLSWPGQFDVTAQDPEPDRVVERASFITVSFRRRNGGASADDRLPESPPPSHLVARAEPEPPPNQPAKQTKRTVDQRSPSRYEDRMRYPSGS